MTPRFKTVCTFSSALCLALALVWLTTPWLVLEFWGVVDTASADMVARRSGALFLGLGFMLASLRNLPPSVTRTKMVDGFALSCLALAALGLSQCWLGHAGPGLALAAIVELLTAYALFTSVRRHAQPSPNI
jgi:hypothetical protein